MPAAARHDIVRSAARYPCPLRPLRRSSTGEVVVHVERRLLRRAWRASPTSVRVRRMRMSPQVRYVAQHTNAPLDAADTQQTPRVGVHGAV